MYNREKVIDTIYTYVKKINSFAIVDNWEEARKVYSEGMADLETCYKNNEIGYSDYEWLQDVLAGVN
ncbi:MAG: hypothetical protein WCO84_00930 [bacterium]